MKQLILILLFLITACSGGGGGGGGSSSPISSTACNDNNASNKGQDGYCSCNSGYVLETSNNSCVVPSAEVDNKTYSGVYTDYYPQQTQTTPCSGRVTTTRSLLYCLGSDLSIADNSKCASDTDATSFVLSRSGSIEVSKTNPSLTNGKEYMTCSSGMTSGTRNVICDINYSRSGTSVSNYTCVPSSYTGTYSSYYPAQSDTTPCQGIVSSSRSVTSCVLASNGSPVAVSYCSVLDLMPTIQVQSKAGSISVSPTNPSLTNGSEVMTCDIGATTGTRSVSCNGGYHVEGTTLSNKNCYSNTKTCTTLPTGYTAGNQEWNSLTSSWGSCIATACATGYTWTSGSCLSNSLSEKLLFNQDTGFKILANGSLKSWGDNFASKLGIGDSVSSYVSSPTVVNVGSGRTVKKVITDNAASYCAILDDDSLKCWGVNNYGQLGVGDFSTKNVPTSVNLGGSIKELISAQNSYCAILTNGSLKCWGYNGYGELGDGTTTNKSTPTTINLGTGRTAKKVVMSKDSGGNTSCAILDDDSLKCWGVNTYGQVGNGLTNTVTNPTNVSLGSGRSAKEVYLFSKALDSTKVSTCVILDDGSLKCWGYNGYGKLGIGNSINQSSPQSVNLGTGRTIKKLFNGNEQEFMCAILDNDSVKCWGRNDQYQLGDGTTTTRTSPTQISFSSNKTVRDLSLSGTSFYAIHIDGSLSSWGFNSRGQLGVSGSPTTPQLVSLTKQVSKISTVDYLACILYTDGSVGCSGDNLSGSLGNGSSVGYSNVFVDVLLGASAKELRTNLLSSCAVLLDDSVKCWGKNNSGQLGNGNNTNQSTPQLLSL